uniref:FGFR1 oncogene partner 2 homolog n=1 Tax=Strigamia maritima TaxID=126957 RepID=T1JNM9_STRMM
MALTVQQILSDAKRLVGRLRDHDSAADNLISEAQALHKQVDAMKQYQEDIVELNTVAGQRPRSALVLGIQHENRHLRALQQENKELRGLLEEHQSALELIMTKYRQHIVKLLEASKAEQSLVTMENPKILQERIDQVCEMAAIMAKAIHIDDIEIAKENERLVRLNTENKCLRELLEISCKAGSQTQKLDGPETIDRQSQTDPS